MSIHSATDPTPAAPAPRSRTAAPRARAARFLVPASASILLFGLLVSAGGLMAPSASPSPSPSPSPSASPSSSPARAAGQAPLDHDRFLLNALLVPAIDGESEPPRWVDPRPRLACGRGSDVRVDGHRLRPGEAMPVGRFVLDWVAHDCRPFGANHARFDGALRLDVQRTDDAYRATVVPQGMVVTNSSGRVWRIRPGTVSTPIGLPDAVASAALVPASRPLQEARP
ncbi:MAG: hypothetical protein ABWZ78_11325 [Burkholderiaceae bacterium]